MSRSWHLKTAHALWENHVQEDDCVIDATAGNGYDTLALCKLIKTGTIYVLDIQKEALNKTKEKIEQNKTVNSVIYICQSHAFFPADIAPYSVSLIVYNLGYLPGGDKRITTKSNTTITSLKAALPLLKPDGALSIMLYPGHEEGEKEAQAVLDFAKNLPQTCWEIIHYQNEKPKAPSLLWIKNAASF